MHPYSEAIESFLRKAFDQALEALEGIPEADLASWRPGQAHGEISTLYGLATHIAGATEFWVVEAAGGADVHRNRPGEFAASGSLADLRARYDEVMAEVRDLLSRLTDDDLAGMYRREANPAQGVSAYEGTRAECIVHALEHAALHVGHLEIERQVWDAERGPAAPGSG
jgi:hypothetical protein